jgi:peptide/nickel transport system substrate-binding protein
VRIISLLIVTSMMLAGVSVSCAPVAAPVSAPRTASRTAAEAAETTTTTPTAVAGGTLVRAMTSEPAQIDPQGAPSSGLSLVLPYLYDTLVIRDTDNRLLPLLAERWDAAPDGRTITMTLRSGVTFQDGSPLTADSVRLTFERFKKIGSKSPIYSGVQQIAAIEAIGDLSVRFIFDKPAANFWSTISMPYAAIVSPASIRQAETDGKAPLVGTGPFTLGEWKAGQSITLLRNPNYRWGPELSANRNAPYLEKMVFKVIPDATTQLAALETGEVDAIFINQPEHAQKLSTNPGVGLEPAVLNSLIYLGFNTGKAPWDDVRVRQALAHAVNKDEIMELALGGVGIKAYAPLPPTLLGFDETLKQNELGFDPAKSESLLSTAGFVRTGDGHWVKDGKSLQGVLLTSNRAPNETIAVLLQSQFKAIGVPVEIQQLDSKAVMDASNQGKFDLLLWRYDWNDPDALSIYLGSDRIGSTNRVAYSDAALDRLLARGASELDEGKRKQIYLEAQKLVLAEAPWQPLYVPVDLLAISKKVDGAKIGYMGRLLVNDARVAKDK